MPRRTRSPLPQRGGLDPTRIKLPDQAHWSTVREHLLERFDITAEALDARFHAGDIADITGPISADTPFHPGGVIWAHRDLPSEIPVPFGVQIVHRDENILVVDKPHFLATTPRGKHIAETALVRLRRHLELPELAVAHRLDRMTAGLLLLVIRPRLRGAYQRLFQNRLVHKEYQAVARHDPRLEFPRTVRSRLVKHPGVLAAERTSGPDNSATYIRLLEHRAGLGRYQLFPRTGRTHQLRAHMHQLGLPILDEDLYPEVRERDPADFSRPLQLLASVLEFTDPVTGHRRRFETRRDLAAWPEEADRTVNRDEDR